MPSIPQSLLWISLVVLWLFVLVPMLINKRETVRRTSDVALATRVLNSAANSRLLRRRKPAAGHAHDPDWRPSDDDLDEFEDEFESEYADPIEERGSRGSRAVMRVGPADDPDSRPDEPDYLDVDVVAEAELPAGSSAPRAEQLELRVEEPVAEALDDELVDDDAASAEPGAEPDAEPDADAEADTDVDAEPEADTDGAYETEAEYQDEFEDDSPPEEPEPLRADPVSAARRRRFESKTAAAVAERKYRFRKRMLSALLVLMVASAVAACTVSPTLWWACASVALVTVLYLAYLRRQTRIEEQLRRRRAERLARSRLGVQNARDRDFDVVPARRRRPGSVVLDIDDEDPAFEHLEYTPFSRHFDLPRAAGQ
ncbi:MAG: hypothetical protein IRZ17_08870 [Mycolicibacterium hassiacum]|uniref:divisome protein SepX/GlpR n=1 Tax=Mycolicibacterium hassiacum TaxID=46351 RepID=UPI0023F82435|nr:gephyrin-like molybdotransferase receptor GlpR [Mycolicibacterium hassiacum]MBX5486716.1 hypothetical protein [Mycolicibacterium hassiacum]